MDEKNLKEMRELLRWDVSARKYFIPNVYESWFPMSFSEDCLLVARLVHKISRTKSQIFKVRNYKSEKSKLSLAYSKLANGTIYHLEALPLGKEIFQEITGKLNIMPFIFLSRNPIIELFFNSVKNREFLVPKDDEQDGFSIIAKTDALNGVVGSIRQELKSEKFKRKIKSFLLKSHKNYIYLTGFVDGWLKDQNELCVLRLDFISNATCVAYSSDIKPIIELRDRVEQELQSQFPLFNNLLGYAINLEYTDGCKFMFRVLALVAGGKQTDDVEVAEKMGQHLSDIMMTASMSENLVAYFNCNRYKNELPQCGLGFVPGDSVQSRDLLRKMAFYMTKMDSLFHMHGPVGADTFVARDVKR